MTSAPANQPTPHNPFIGKVMGGRYQVDRLIGRGGMGLVYVGRELPDERQLVLKMLAPHWADDPSAVGRFEREGKRLSELRHPNIVELFDIGHEENHPYIVMEFIRGIPLRKVLKRKGRLRLSEFFPIAAQLLAAVAYAHDKGIMLRDIKPSNVMLCEHEGKADFVKVLDFGLAKMVDGDDVEVTKSNLIGTAGYLAPELIRGGDADVRVDVYALSIMFFIMLTGSSPIRGENDGAILYNHVHGEPRPFRDAGVDDVPQGLQDLVYRGMSKEADDRHAHAGEMLRELQTLAAADAFELPSITTDTVGDVERYWERKFQGVGLSDEEPSSSLWTRPRLEELLEGDAMNAEAVAASDEDPYGSSADGSAEDPSEDPVPDVVELAPGVPRLAPPQPSAAIRARTSGRGNPTEIGLPAIATDGSEPVVPPPDVRRPKPARVPASSNMERALPGPPPRRRTLQAGSGPAEPAPSTTEAVPGPKQERSITEVPAPVPVEAPSPLEGANEVGPLHLELQLPPRRRKSRPDTRPVSVVGHAARQPHDEGEEPSRVTDEFEAEELDEFELEEIEVDDDDEHALLAAPTFESDDPTTDPVAPATRLAAPAGDAPDGARAPIMAAAEPPPAKTGIGVVLAIAVAAALALGGVVTWLALRSEDGSTGAVADALTPTLQEADSNASDSQGQPAGSAALAADPIADANAGIDPDAPGTIRVEGPDGGEAFINDESVGSVPAEVSRPPGLYEIRVEARGYASWSTDVHLQPEGRAKLVASNTASDAPTPTTKRNKTVRRTVPSTKTAPQPEPEPEPVKKSQPTADPPPKKKNPPPAEDDDVFMKRGQKKDDGIFLPVGK